jgi:hypothetical protein
MLHSTIHFPSTKIGIGRGLELLPEDGCLREKRARWRNRLLEMEGSAAGCFFVKGESDEMFRRNKKC